jgi:hypothetical protein
MTSRAQDALAEQLAVMHGRSVVMPLDGTACVVIVGLNDDREACAIVAPPSGIGARAATAREIRRAEQRQRARYGVEGGMSP